MQFPFFIARRYVFAKHSLNFITIITTISIVGIAIGVAALIIVMSVFNGFQELQEKFLVGFDPHVRISSARNTWINNADSVLHAVKALPGVHAASPIVAGKVVGVRGKSMQALFLQGVDHNNIGAVSGISNSVVTGVFSVDERDGMARIILGIGLADKLRVFTGDTLALVSPPAIEQAIAQSSLPVLTHAVVAGLFQTNVKEYDAFQAYTSVSTARRLFKAPAAGALYIDLRSNDIAQSEALKHTIIEQFPALRAETWYDLHRDLYNVMRFERMAAFVVLALIIFIAVFNVFASLTMTVAEKRAEIGVLKAMGASANVITRIFFGESVIIGVVGTILGVLLGVGVSAGQATYGWFALDTTRYIVPALPIALELGDVVLISAVALILAPLAGIYPARKAARVRAARALMNKA